MAICTLKTQIKMYNHIISQSNVMFQTFDEVDTCYTSIIIGTNVASVLHVIESEFRYALQWVGLVGLQPTEVELFTRVACRMQNLLAYSPIF